MCVHGVCEVPLDTWRSVVCEYLGPRDPAQHIGLGGWAFTHWALCWLMGIVCEASCQHRSLMVPHPPLRNTVYYLSCQESNHRGPKHPSKPPTISWNMVEYLSWVWTLLAGGLFAGRRKWGSAWTLLDWGTYRRYRHHSWGLEAEAEDFSAYWKDK